MDNFCFTPSSITYFLALELGLISVCNFLQEENWTCLLFFRKKICHFHISHEKEILKNNSGKQTFQFGCMEAKFNILLLPGAISCHTRPASPRVTGEGRSCNICRSPAPEQAVRGFTISDLAGQKWSETMFCWNLNSQASSALVKVHQNQSISMQYFSFDKVSFSTKKQFSEKFLTGFVHRTELDKSRYLCLQLVFVRELTFWQFHDTY